MLYQKISDIPVNLKGKVAIKVHMGERGNKTHISPEDVRAVFDRLKKAECRPFLVDTTCLYTGPRQTPEGYMQVAKENGFGGFPVVIARDDEYIEKGGFKIAKVILEADSLMVLSHGKGHQITAYGGAIKNLGMGCVNADSKSQIHTPTAPVHNPAKCKKCRACEKVCPCTAIKVKDDGFLIEEKKCCGCQRCIKVCSYGALKSSPSGLEKSFRLFCQAAKQITGHFEGRIAYITALKNITEFCDCRSDSGKIVCPDIGYLSGPGPLEIDMEAVSLIRKKNPKALDFRTWDMFEKEAKRVFGK